MRISRDEFEINATGTWKSPYSGAVYPAGWEVRVPSIDLLLVVTPLQADQELNLTYTYWEGAVSIEGVYQGQAVNGNGYIEMTGYAGSFAGEF
jgi:predicted secreted hydrolase